MRVILWSIVRRHLVVAALVFCLGLAGHTGAAAAGELPRPAGAVVLTVTGGIARTNAPGQAEFDLDMLRSLGLRTVTTDTIWTDGPSTFEGVAMRHLLQAVGAEGSMLTLVAVNDYSVSFPLSDLAEDAPLLAFARDGAPMSLRDKGPIWAIYPYDEKPEYRTELIYARSVWQLVRISVHD